MSKLSDKILDYPKAVKTQFFNDESNAKSALLILETDIFSKKGQLVEALFFFKQK